MLQNQKGNAQFSRKGGMKATCVHASPGRIQNLVNFTSLGDSTVYLHEYIEHTYVVVEKHALNTCPA